jgi:GcrA cell cycle regulator
LGISKNAVIGKAHRLKLPPRPSPIRAERVMPRPRKPVLQRPPQTVVKAAPALEVVPQAAPQSEPRPVPQRARRRSGGPGCLWPIGDPAEPSFHFCGDQPVPGKPYCDVHCAKAYIVKSRNSSEAA